MIGTLITALIVLAIVGLILWGIQQIPGIPNIVKVILYVVVGVILLIWLLQTVQGHNFSLSRNAPAHHSYASALRLTGYLCPWESGQRNRTDPATPFQALPDCSL